MNINKIIITNFKSIYNRTEIDFCELKGMIKLTGTVGAGKTTIGDAILYGLFGTIQGKNIPNLVSWGMSPRSCEIEIFLESKGKNIHIIRSVGKMIFVEIDGQELIVSNKKDIQNTLETDYYDISKKTIEALTILSFNNFKSIMNMNSGETNKFIDSTFKLNIFSKYNDIINNLIKNLKEKSIGLNSNITYLKNNISDLQSKLNNDSKNELLSQKNKLNDELIICNNLLDSKNTELNDAKKIYNDLVESKTTFLAEYNINKSTLTNKGKLLKREYDNIKNGVCPVCKHKIDNLEIVNKESELNTLRAEYSSFENKSKKILKINNELLNNQNNIVLAIEETVSNIKDKIKQINDKLLSISIKSEQKEQHYANFIKLNNDNIKAYNKELKQIDTDLSEYAELLNIISVDSRASYLSAILPNINNKIQYYLTKFELPYLVHFDNQFKCHINIISLDNKEINYNDLSTGQRKLIDMSVILGILKNFLVTSNFNILFLDELFTNLDSNSRDMCLKILNDENDNKTIFIINHAEMSDDFFAHHIEANLISENNDKIIKKVTKYIKKF